MSAAPSKTRVLLVAGRASLAAGLRALLAAGDLEVVAEASTLASAAAGVRVADVAVVGEPDAATLAGARTVSVVVVSGDTSLLRVLSSRQDRPWGWVSPGADAAELQAAVRAVAAGLTVVPPSLAPPVLSQLAGRSGGSRDDGGAQGVVESLTARERDVLQLLAEGMANRAIASALGISEHTVKFHLASIFGKLGASTRTDAVRRGLRRGLIQI
jgi:DNA-binding NarL/FixJ family response regulator